MKLIDVDQLIVFLYEEHVKADRFEKCMIEQFINLLRHCPEVKLERKKGKWIWDKHTGEYECSECGRNPVYERTTPDDSEIDKYRYCRWCGAPMEVSE